MEITTKKPILPKDIGRLVSGLISFLNDKDKEITEKSETKGDSK